MITSLVLEWHDCSKHCAADVSRSRLTVCRNRNSLDYKECDGKDNILSEQRGTFLRHQGKRFFCFLEEINCSMTEETGYFVDVCDGSCWKLKLRHSGNIVQKLEGTMEHLPHGKDLENELIKLCKEAGVTNPLLFVSRGKI